MKENNIPIEQIYGFWCADSHIEEYPEEPSNWELIWELFISEIRRLLSKLTTK